MSGIGGRGEGGDAAIVVKTFLDPMNKVVFIKGAIYAN